MGRDRDREEETTELQGTIVAAPKHKDAFLLSVEVVDRNVWSEEEEVWIPYSQVEKCDVNTAELEKGDKVIVEIPYWLAVKKELVP